MIIGFCVVFILTLLTTVRYLQRRKQSYLLSLEESFGVDIKTERKLRERERIRINLLLGLASIPFALFPFICFFFFMDSHLGLELFPVILVAWGMIYFWFATEHYNVFRENITYEEILTGAEKDYFKRAYSPFVHAHESIDIKHLPGYLVIRDTIRVFMRLSSELHCNLSRHELEEKRKKLRLKQEEIDKMCWKLIQEMNEKEHRK